MHVCLAPGDGLMLDKVGYDKYNENEERKKERVQIKLESQRQEVEKFFHRKQKKENFIFKSSVPLIPLTKVGSRGGTSPK